MVELNCLEFEFLFCLDFRLIVIISVFESYCFYFEKEVMIMEKKIEWSFFVFGSVFIFLVEKLFGFWNRVFFGC